MFKRPSPGDTDEDLLKFQQQFLASKSQPAVKILPSKNNKSSTGCDKETLSGVSSSIKHDSQPKRDVVTLGELPLEKPTAGAEPPLKKSRFKRSQTEAKHDHTSSVDPEIELDTHDQHITKLLADIVEREFDNVPICYPQANASGGFPKVLHRGDIKQEDPGEGSGKRCSLFAKQFAKCSAADFGIPDCHQLSDLKMSEGFCKTTVFNKERGMQPAESSRIVSGTGLDPVRATTEAEHIHLENKAQLQSMTDDEILAEQKKLLEVLDPDVVSFLKRRSQKKHDTSPQTDMETTNTSQTEMDSTDESHMEMDSMEQSCMGKDNMKQSHTGISVTDQGDTEMIASEKCHTQAVNREHGMRVSNSKSLLKPPKEWLHMDKLEPEKLQWMKDLPPPNADDNSTGKSARFDLHGDLIRVSKEIPTHLGLHHHGEEQERAGYTLEEMFHLARSTNMQQRALALNTLAKVIRKARQGSFHGCVTVPLIPAMVDGGLVFILRWALDDKTDNTMSAAVNALHALVVVPEDELGLDNTLCWYRGYRVPCIHPVPVNQDDPDEKLSDAELVKQDMIRGLLEMSLLPRLRYILEVWQPPGAVVIQILDILIRFCRHSNQVAYDVIKCPRLMGTVFKELLTWKIPEPWPEPLISWYGIPCSRALKLIRVLCMSSRSTAAHIIAHYSLMNCLVLYIGQWQQQSDAFHPELHELILESFRTWKVCIIYGLGISHYHECYAVLMEQLKKSCQLTRQSGSRLVQLACALISFMESVVHVAAKNTLNALSEMRKTSMSFGSEIEHTETTLIPDLNWSHVTGLSEPVLFCLHRCLDEFCQFYLDEKYDLSLAVSCLNFISSWLGRVNSMPRQEIIDILDKIQMLCTRSIFPTLRSRGFSSALASLRKHSVILDGSTDRRSEDLTSLPSLGSLIGDKTAVCPLLSQQSTVHFVLAFVRLCHAIKLHKGMTADIYPALLTEPELMQYLRQICQAKRSHSISNYFAQFETRLHHSLLSLVVHCHDDVDVSLYHHLALKLLSHIHEGLESDVHQLLSSVIFNPDLLSDMHETSEPQMTASLDNLKLQNPARILSATEKEIIVDKVHLLDDLLKSIVSIRNTYLAAFGGHEKAVEKSKISLEEYSGFTESVMFGRCGELVVPIDWMFLPLVEIYNMTCNISDKRTKETSFSAASIAMVTNCLRFVYCIEVYRPRTLDMVTFTVRLSRLMCTFLAGSDLFLDSGIQSYLAALLQHFCKPALLDKMDFTKPIPGLASFYDLYVMLLNQFAAVSFGDWLFASYLLLPLQQRHSIMFRRAVWGEYSIILRSLRMKVSQVLVPLERFLDPEELNLELLRLYFQTLLSRSISPDQTPLPYLIAIHHINRFMFNQQHKHRKMAHAMMQHAVSMEDMTLRHHLLYYKLADKDKEHGMELYTELPPNRQVLLNSINKR